MKEYINWDKAVDIALIAGVVLLAMNDKEGWGWLLFFYILKN